ncbi:hypothetical protein Tco_1059126, partial [Tanacetum coccineum]
MGVTTTSPTPPWCGCGGHTGWPSPKGVVLGGWPHCGNSWWCAITARHHKVRLWWLPRCSARPHVVVLGGGTLRHHLGLRHHSPTPQGAAVVAVLSSDRHHDGGNRSGVLGGFMVFRGGVNHGCGQPMAVPRQRQRLVEPPLLLWCRQWWCGSELVLRWWCMRRCGRSDEDGGEDGVKILAGEDGGSPEKSAGNFFPAGDWREKGEEMGLFAFINHADPTKDVGVHVVNEEGTADGQESLVDAGIVRIEDEVPATVAEKAKGSRKKRKATGGASSFSLPPKKLKDDHDTSGAGASTGGKSLATLQSLLEGSTLLLTPERESEGLTDSITGPNLRTQRPTKRFVIPSDSSHHSGINAADIEVSSVVRSPILDPPIMTTTVATMVVADTSSVPVPRAGNEPVHHILFVDFASIGEANPDVSSPSYHAGTELSTDSFYVSQEMDSETLHQTYVPKWNVTNDSALDDPDVFRNVIDHLAPPVLFSQLRSMDYDQLLVEFNVGVACQTCLSSEVRLRLEHDLRDKKKLEEKCRKQADLSKERDVEIASLKSRLSLKEAEATEAIWERNLALEEEKTILDGKVTALASAAAAKDNELASLTAQVAQLTKDLSNFQLSYDELSVKDEQVKVLSDKVAGLDAELMGMDLHLDEEFYPQDLAAFGGVISRAIDKGMQDGLVAGIDHGKAGRGLINVAAYNPSAEANYVSSVNTLYVVHARVQRIRGNAASQRLSISD